MKRFQFFLFLALFSLCGSAAQSQFYHYIGHGSVSMMSAVTISEQGAVRFGNFVVTALGNGDASILLKPDGTRQATSGLDVIALLNGNTGPSHGLPDMGSQGPGYYKISHAGSGMVLNVSFADSAGTSTSIGTCPAASAITLTGPVGSSNFCVDSLTFSSPANAFTPTSVTADAGGNATITVGATLHTMSGATIYAPGTYTGTFDVMISY